VRQRGPRSERTVGTDGEGPERVIIRRIGGGADLRCSWLFASTRCVNSFPFESTCKQFVRELCVPGGAATRFIWPIVCGVIGRPSHCNTWEPNHEPHGGESGTSAALVQPEVWVTQTHKAGIGPLYTYLLVRGSMCCCRDRILASGVRCPCLSRLPIEAPRHPTPLLTASHGLYTIHFTLYLGVISVCFAIAITIAIAISIACTLHVS
jgi:hypothetical protein